MRLWVLRLLLFFPCSLPALAQYIDVENESFADNFSRLAPLMHNTHVELSIEFGEIEASIPVRYFNQTGVERMEFTIEHLQIAASAFVEWAEHNDYDLAPQGERRQIALDVYGVEHQVLNSPRIMHFVPRIANRQRSVVDPIMGMYDHQSISEINVIFISDSAHAKTIAHELGHFLGDYFRVYDNYYKLPNGTIRSEDLAYEFDGYFEGYLMRLLMARRQAERERERE